ncbi:alpha/beta hydrolase [Massilia sp. METH4]|uniref:alpha/beta hydrolase n=1 Tax=Massilia sp. METH4 TaxID=3123041 RepID=UPI0030CE9DAC
MAELKLAVIDVKPGATMESQSGLQMLRPRIYGAYAEPAGRRKVAAVIMHPTSNFMGHYLIQPLAERGICCMGLNSRYVNNDTVLLMERVIQDLGAGVKYLRDAGYEKVVLIGNSGGAALSSFYQAQAENLTAVRFAHGDPTGLSPEDLPPVDGIALCAAHEGRSRLFLNWLDPSVVDESDPLSADPEYDMFNPEHGPPYSTAFLEKFRAKQRQRRDRIENWALARLRMLRSDPKGPQDQAFVVYRTLADPRCLDLSLDPNDREIGSVWGDARKVNYAGNSMGRYTSLTAFLSQWSSRSQADGPSNLANTSVPVLLATYTGDASTFPSTRDAWLQAAPGRIRNIDILGGNHYLAGQPEQVMEVADAIAVWAHGL